MSDYSGGEDYDEKDEYCDDINCDENYDEEIEDDEIDDENDENDSENQEDEEQNDYGSEQEKENDEDEVEEVEDYNIDIPMETGEQDTFKIKFEKDKLLQKITRYMKQGKFTDTDYRYMLYLCRNENDYMTETKTGIHLKFGQYSDETLLSIKEFVEQSEANWKEAEKEALTQQENRKKNRDNETIDFFKKRTDEKEERREKNIVKHTPAAATPVAGNEFNFLSLGVDNKKKPLNEYKGIFQRIMRKSRAIKNNKSIPNKKKKRTTEILNGNNEEENVYDESIPVDIEREDDEDNEEENEEENEDNEDNEDNESEESDEDDEDNDEEEEEEDVSSISSSEDSDDYKDSDESSDEEEGDRADLEELGKKYK